MSKATCLGNICYIKPRSSEDSIMNPSNVADSTLIPLTKARSAKFTAIDGVVIFPIEELRELSRAEIETLYRDSLVARDNLTCLQSLMCIELSEHNFSERVHWRKAQREIVKLLVNHIAAVTEKLEYIKTYLSLLNGHRLRFVFLEEHTKPPIAVKVGAHLEVDVETPDGESTIYSLYVGPHDNPNNFSANVEKARKAHEHRGDPGVTVAPANDLIGALELSWTHGQNKDDVDHVETCKRIHAWLDKLIIPSFKRHYILTENREKYVDDFASSCIIKSTGMVWVTPSSMWISKQTTRVMMFTLARLAVQYGVVNKIIPVIVEQHQPEYRMAA